MTDQPMATTPSDTLTTRRAGFSPVAVVGFFIWDLAVVASFVAFGRDTHAESLDFGRSFQTAAPFLIALAAAWIPGRVRIRPEAVTSGLVIGATTALLGLVLRRLVFDEGLSGAFPFITTAYLVGLATLGRVLWAQVRRRSR